MPSEKQKAVFLDRDGVINYEHGDYTYQLEDFRINEGVVEALKKFHEKKFLLIVISNQSGIAKGIYSREQAEYLHLHLQRFLRTSGIQLTEFYFCPHHPDHGHCICRKPDSLLLEKAIARYDIDPARSYFIGDADRDVVAGSKAGLNAIRIEPNSSLLSVVDRIG